MSTMYYYTPDGAEQNRPQLLNKHVFFGTLQTLNNLDLIRSENIRFFVGVDIPTEQMAVIYNESNLKNLYNSKDEIIVVNFDSRFLATVVNENENMKMYHWNNTGLLNQLVQNNTTGNTKDLQTIKSNVITIENLEKFQIFNDLITLFSATGGNNKTLVFSETENNENLITLLISIVLKNDPTIKILDALQFIKSLKNGPNDNLREEKIFWCSGLLNYYEQVRRTNINWGLSQQNKYMGNCYSNQSQSPQKRSKREETVIPTSVHNITKSKGNETLIDVARSKRARSD